MYGANDKAVKKGIIVVCGIKDFVYCCISRLILTGEYEIGTNLVGMLRNLAYLVIAEFHFASPLANPLPSSSWRERAARS